jgi:predicted ribosomally synthesized peptide with SipW-like signal peptide
MVWDDYLYTVRSDLDSRMQSAIRAPDPVREGRHPDQVRRRAGGRTFVHIPQIGEGVADNDSAASSFPLRRRPIFDYYDPDESKGAGTMNKTRKVLRSVVVLGVVGAVATAGAFSAFSSQTENPGNQITAGTVDVTDNDAGGALYNLAAAKPLDPKENCIEVTYSGSLAADVKLYRAPGALGSLAPYANLKVEYGTQASPSFPSCTGFNAAGTLYDADLQGFATTYAGGYAATPGVDGDWDNGEKLVYRVTVSIDDDANAEGLSTGAHALRWEARNQ